MSKRVSEEASLELTFLAALDSIHADVDLSEIAEIRDWSRAVRGKFHGSFIAETLGDSNPRPRVPNAIGMDALGSSSEDASGVVLGTSGHMASEGSVQYSQMATPQLVAVCTSESSEGAWIEFVRRFQPLIAGVIAKVVRRYGNVSRDVVDDLVQETLVKLCLDNLRALKGFVTAHENAFHAFLKIVATNIAMNHFRMTARLNRGSGEAREAVLFSSAPQMSDNPASELERKIFLEKIDEILKTHAQEPNFERDYAIFWLYYSQGFTAKAIAALPGIKLSVKGVESTLFRLTRQIRSALTQSRKNAAE